MDAELKEKWVKALRSGEYQQDFGKLKTRKGYCCLGVLAEIQGAELDAHDYEVRLDGVVLESKGMLNPKLRGGLTDGQTRLLSISMNDNGTTFSEIADYIEANL